MTIQRRDRPPALEVSGLVESGAVWTVGDLGTLPGRVADLGDVADGFVGEAAPLRAVIDAAGPLPEATHGTVVSDDGLYRASIPLEDLLDRGWVAFRLHGDLLPRERGGPLRVVVPEGRTLCWNVKGVVAIEITAGAAPDSVPANPTH